MKECFVAAVSSRDWYVLMQPPYLTATWEFTLLKEPICLLKGVFKENKKRVGQET